MLTGFRDKTVLALLTKTGNILSKHKFHFNNMKKNRPYVSEIVGIISDIQEDIARFRKLVKKRIKYD